jgi:hypothetical protein
LSESTIFYAPISANSQQTKLVEFVESAGFDGEVLRKLLWLINAHVHLVSFPTICENILAIFKLTEKHWHLGEDDLELDGIGKILEYIVSERRLLAKALAKNITGKLAEDFDRPSTERVKHPILSHRSKQHPLYTLLWSITEADNLDRFRLLQGQMFFAYAKNLLDTDNQAEYEAYDGENEWTGTVNSPYEIALSLRRLSEAKNAGILSLLRTEAPPKIFKNFYEELIIISGKYWIDKLSEISKFLRKCSGDIKSITRSRGNGSGAGNGGGKFVFGFIPEHDGLSHNFTQAFNNDDPDSIVFAQNIYSDFESPESISQLIDLDLNPLEDELSTLILTDPYESIDEHGAWQAIGKEQLRHIVMVNQRLPWNYELLNIDELANLFNGLHSRALALGSKRDKIDLLEWSAIVLLRIVIFSGSTIEKACEIAYLDRYHINSNEGFSIISTEEGAVYWRIESIQPEYALKTEVQDGTERSRSDYIYLREESDTFFYINKLIELRQAINPNCFANSRKLFNLDHATLVSAVKELIETLSNNSRITISKLEKCLHSRLIQASNGDELIASMITGQQNSSTKVRLHYSTIPIPAIKTLYSNVVKQMRSELLAHVDKKLPPSNVTGRTKTDKATYGKYAGAKNCPTVEAFKSMVAQLKNDIISSTPTSYIEQHNQFTLYTLLMFGCATGMRAINTPYIHLSEIDQETGYTTFTDKDSGFGYKTRLVMVPKMVIKQMKHYANHLELLNKTYPIPACSFPCYFLETDKKGNVKCVEVKPSTLKPHWSKYSEYSANVHRRFMRSMLMESNFPIELIDLYMGHWSTGSEPWGSHSSMSIHDALLKVSQAVLGVMLLELDLFNIEQVGEPVKNPSRGRPRNKVKSKQ